MKELWWGSLFIHNGIDGTDEHQNYRYTVKCSKCGKESYYKIKCPSVKEIIYQDTIKEIIGRSTKRYEDIEGILCISDDDFKTLVKIFGHVIINDNGVRTDYYDKVSVAQHWCGHCDEQSLYVIQNW